MKDLPYITIGRFSVLFIILLLSTTTIAQNREMKEYNVDSTLYVYYQQCKANIQSPIVLPMSDTLFTMAQTKSDPRMQAVALSTKLDYYYFKEPGSPSTRTKGLGVAPNEPTPRMRKLEPLPGCALTIFTCKPAALPAKA